jgi:hypothetical protein
VTSLLARAPRSHVDVLAVTIIVVASTLGALAIASGNAIPAIGLAAIPVALLIVPRAARAAGLPVGYFSIEVPIALLLLSTLVFRIRDAEALSANPLDSAALYRLACVGLAGMLGWVTLLRSPIARERVRLPFPVLLYAAYDAVVFMGAPLSVAPMLTAYRGVELGVGVLVVVAAVHYAGREAVDRIEQALYAFLVLLVVSVWIGVAAFPGEAVFTDVAPIPFQIQGVYPAVSSNGVGETGALLFLWSLGARVSGRASGRWNAAFIGLGAVTLVAAQYRTGYLAVAVALMVLLVARGRRVLAVAAAVAVLFTAFISGKALVQAAEPYVLRGQDRELVSGLSGRVELWDNAIPVWRESPLFGKGLLTATRFEVLAPLGFTTVSTIHGTWIEALVGTGIVGVALLALYLILLLRASLRDLLARGGLVYPSLLIVFVGIRSITGPSFEVFGVAVILLLMLAYKLALDGSQGVHGSASPSG